MRAALGSLFVIFPIAAAACGGPTAPSLRQVPPDHPIDRVDVVAADPAGNTTIAAGTQVTVRVTVRYELVGAETGTIGLVIQDQTNRCLATCAVHQPVARGTGSLTLTETVQIPAAGVTGVNVFLPLFIGEQSVSRHMAAVHYNVR